MAACIYIACREHSATRTFKEICNLTNVSKKEIGRCFKLLQPHFDTKTKISLDAYITRFASNLEIGQDVRKATLIVSSVVTRRLPIEQLSWVHWQENPQYLLSQR